MRWRSWLGPLVFGWLAAAPVHAADLRGPGPSERAVCREAGRLLGDIRAEVGRLNGWNDSLDALVSGTLSSDVTLEELFGVTSEGSSPVEVTELSSVAQAWPVEVACATYAQEYADARADLLWLANSIQRKRETFWSGTSAAQQAALRDIWLSRQQLLRGLESLRSLLAEGALPGSAEFLKAASEDFDELRAFRLVLMRLLTAVGKPGSAEQARVLIERWRDAVERPAAPVAPDAQQARLWSAEVQAAAAEFARLFRADLALLRRHLNAIRAAQWEQPDLDFAELSIAASGGRLPLLALELRAVANRMLFAVGSIDSSWRVLVTNGAQGGQAWLRVLEYLVWLAALPLLVVVARGLAPLALALQQRIAVVDRGRPVATQFSRMTAAIPPLVPWLVGWFGLDLLGELYARKELDLLLALIPLARLYIVFNVVLLAGTWLVVTIAEQGGIYLSPEATRETEAAARWSAWVVMLPWLLSEFAAVAIGASLIHDLVRSLAEVALYAAISLLLVRRRGDLVAALKARSPPSADPWIDRLLDGWRFPVLAPFAVLPLLVWHMVNALHRLALGVDGYRKLAARGFMLRAQAVERAEAEKEPAVADDYRCWFDDAGTDQAAPFLDVGLLQRLRERMAPWLADRSEENTLLLVGQRGMGKSRVLERLRQELAEQHPEVSVCRVKVPAKTTRASAVLQFLGQPLGVDLAAGPAALVKGDAERTPTIVMVDDAHNLFLRRVGGLEGWQTLLGLTNARVANVFWIIAINDQSWAYLANVFARDFQFRNVLWCKPWTQSEIRSLTLSRNQLSGYRIRYDDVLLATRGPQAGSVRNAEQRYFGLLWDACDGNPMLALQLWLTSVRTDGRAVVVGLPMEPAGTAMERLAGDFHFVYAAIVIHVTMSSDELIEVTALSGGLVRAALKTGFDMGFIERSEDGRYGIVPVWYPTVVGLLKRKNMLHE